MEQKTDFQLELLAAVCDETGKEFPISCAFSNTVVQGRLVSHTLWLAHQADIHSAATDLQEFAEMYDIAATQGANDMEFRRIITTDQPSTRSDYVHIVEPLSPDTGEVKFWRIRLADVTGWALLTDEMQQES